MAATSVSQITSTINDHLITVRMLGDKPAVLSTDVARRFQKKHQHVLRDIERICSILPKLFRASNFGRTSVDVPGPNGAVRQSPAYLLTRDAFSLLVMGFTGKAALLWKLKYIEAFNTLEEAALERHGELARQAGYQQGLEAAQALPAVTAALQQARADTARLFWRFGEKRKRRLRAVVRYRRMGLGIQDIAKLLDIHNREVSTELDAAEALGLLPPRKAGKGQPQ